jgi:hypothetical protein
MSSMLEGRPFSSCEIFNRHFRIAMATCLRIQRDDLTLQTFHIRHIPHTPHTREKLNRLTFAGELLELVCSDQENIFEHIITGDEFWFLPQIQLTLSGHHLEIGSRANETSNFRRGMSYLRLGVRQLDVVLSNLVDTIYSHSRGRSLKDGSVHLHNARLHNSDQSRDRLRATQARRTSQPAKSREWTPRDFFLFGYLEQQRQGAHVSDRESLKSAISRIVSEIGGEALVFVLLDSVEWLEHVIKDTGDCSNI